MHFERIGTAALLGIAATSGLVEARPQSAREKALLGTWNLVVAVEGCRDASDAHRGDLWIFAADGTFRRVNPEAKREQSGRWRLQFDDHELQLTIDKDDTADGRVLVERYPITTLEGRSLELLSPTEVREGMVIRQERVTSFFHS